MDTLKKVKLFNKLLFTSMMLLSTSYSFSQNALPNSSLYSLEFVNGISLPSGDFKNYSDIGFNSSLAINRKFCNNLSIGLSTNYTSLPIKEVFGVSNEKWNSTSISVGPQYNIGNNKFSIELYGKLGLSFIAIPEINGFYPNTDMMITRFEETNTTHLISRLGINLGTEICYGLFFYVNPEYASSLNSSINYSARNLSSAIGPSGRIDSDLASEITFKEEKISFSSFNVNFGIRIDLNGNNNNTRATD